MLLFIYLLSVTTSSSAIRIRLSVHGLGYQVHLQKSNPALEAKKTTTLLLCHSCNVECCRLPRKEK